MRQTVITCQTTVTQPQVYMPIQNANVGGRTSSAHLGREIKTAIFQSDGRYSAGHTRRQMLKNNFCTHSEGLLLYEHAISCLVRFVRWSTVHLEHRRQFEFRRRLATFAETRRRRRRRRRHSWNRRQLSWRWRGGRCSCSAYRTAATASSRSGWRYRQQTLTVDGRDRWLIEPLRFGYTKFAAGGNWQRRASAIDGWPHARSPAEVKRPTLLLAVSPSATPTISGCRQHRGLPLLCGWRR